EDQDGGGGAFHHEEPDHNPEQNRVADGVAHHRHAAQYKEHPWQRAGGRGRRGNQLDIELRAAHRAPSPGRVRGPPCAASAAAMARISSSCFLRRANQAHSSPRFGAKQSEKSTMALTHTTITGPVGRCFSLALIVAPETPANAPKSAESTTMVPSRSVHCRAAAAGATIMALIRITPTPCNPITIATTIKVVSSTSSTRTG